MTWAFGLEMKPATAKFVLVAIADNADDEGRAFPSVDSLVCKTSLDRKTVIHALDQLEQRGLLSDTGERVGRTRQVKVYALVMGPSTRVIAWDGKGTPSGSVPFDEPELGNDTGNGTLQRVPDLPKDSVNGTVPEPERVPKFPPNSTVFPAKGTVFPPKGSQKRDTESSGNPQKEPKGNRQSAGVRARRCPEAFEITDSMRAWARSKVPEVDIDTETEKFRDHEYAKAKTDWPAAWRTWMRNSVDFSRPRSSAPAPEPKLTWRPGPDD